jgi:hypothetical protein
MICIALPCMAISTEQGHLTGSGLDGFYRAGRRVLSRCQLRVVGREPLVVQARRRWSCPTGTSCVTVDPPPTAHRPPPTDAIASAGLLRWEFDVSPGGSVAPEAFGQRLPELYAGRQRTDGGAPLPHPAAFRPAATAAAAAVQLLTTPAGIRPDAPAGTVTLRPLRSAPLGEIVLTGLRVAGGPFSVRVSRLGLAMVEEAVDGLRLGL